MDRKLIHWISGLALYFLLSVLVGVAVFWRFLGLGAVTSWLATSSNPQMALLWFSLFIGALMMTFVRVLGFEFPFFKINIGDDVKRYIAGLPLWMLFILIATSAVGLVKYAPTCQAPETVFFEVLGADKQYQPMEVMTVKPGQSMSIVAKSADADTELSCISWEFVGPAFGKMGEKSGCQVSVMFSDQPGSSFITLASTQNFCNQRSVFSLEVRVEP
jgi:hypothetical protein